MAIVLKPIEPIAIDKLTDEDLAVKLVTAAPGRHKNAAITETLKRSMAAKEAIVRPAIDNLGPEWADAEIIIGKDTITIRRGDK